MLPIQKTRQELIQEIVMSMERVDVSQQEIAASCHISQGHLSKLLDQKKEKVRSISKGLIKVCNSLGISLQKDVTYDPMQDPKLAAALRSTVRGDKSIAATIERVIRALGQEQRL
jgi:predicted XRE-type DNA-binding protein